VYCELANEKDIARKIQEVYKNYEQYKKLGYNGRGKIERSFSTKALKERIKRGINLS
jgi:glycosyltransferase involved in cell wall biosynthesis